MVNLRGTLPNYPRHICHAFPLSPPYLADHTSLCLQLRGPLCKMDRESTLRLKTRALSALDKHGVSAPCPLRSVRSFGQSVWRLAGDSTFTDFE